MNESFGGLTLAIVGGGLSGALVAIHLLRQSPSGTRILLVERRVAAGRGVAYSTECPDHLLNVPAGRISLFPAEPEHFLDWLRARARPGSAEIAAADFLPRSLFGRYVVETLAAAEANANPGVALIRVHGEAVDLEEIAPGRAKLTLADGRSFDADRVLLALGHLPGEYPLKRPLLFYRGPRYVHVPWAPGLMANIGRDDNVLVVGAGLTAVDVIIELDRIGHRGKVYALSRRGFRPFAHQPVAAYPSFFDGETLPRTTSAALHRLRLEVRRAAAQGIDWRAVIDAARPWAPAIWQGFSWSERARFLRHARPFWENHRHRLAPDRARTIPNTSTPC